MKLSFYRVTLRLCALLGLIYISFHVYAFCTDMSSELREAMNLLEEHQKSMRYLAVVEQHGRAHANVSQDELWSDSVHERQHANVARGHVIGNAKTPEDGHYESTQMEKEPFPNVIIGTANDLSPNGGRTLAVPMMTDGQENLEGLNGMPAGQFVDKTNATAGGPVHITESHTTRVEGTDVIKEPLHLSKPISQLKEGVEKKMGDEPTTVDATSSNSKRLPSLPHAIIIGQAKCGTTTLRDFLFRLNHGVNGPDGEVFFFNVDSKFALGLDWYRQQMPLLDPKVQTLVKTPNYFSQADPARVKAMNASVRLILIVCPPVRRTISSFVHNQAAGDWLENNRPFRKLAFTPEGELDTSYLPVRWSIYHKDMENWLQHFPLEQFLIVDGAELVTNPFKVVKEAERFLQLDDVIKPDNFYYDENKGYYCIMNMAGTKECMPSNKGRKHPAIDRQYLDKLDKFFQSSNRIFFEMINKTFDWQVKV